MSLHMESNESMHVEFLCRLSYHQRITEIIPSSFEKLLPLKALPYYKYEEEGAGEGYFLQHHSGF